MHCESCSIWSLCVFVCLQLSGYKANSFKLCKPEKYNGNFPEMAMFERYAVKTSEKAYVYA